MEHSAERETEVGEADVAARFGWFVRLRWVAVPPLLGTYYV
jgi:hypothetical protein